MRPRAGGGRGTAPPGGCREADRRGGRRAAGARLAPRAWGSLVLLVAGLALGAGCAGVRRPALDPPPGHRTVLGRFDLSRFEVRHGLVEIVRDDGTFTEFVPVSWDRSEFAITLPPGRYLVTRLRAFQDGRTFPNDAVWDLGLTFDVGAEAAVYIGTLRVAPGAGRRLRIDVIDEYDDTVRRLRSRYADIPDAVLRALAGSGLAL
jgi:hypothetical protein